MNRDQVSRIQSEWLTPLQMLELDACTRCQECVVACPVVRFGYPDGAMERITGWRRNCFNPDGLERLVNWISPAPELSSLLPGLSRCTTCGACSFVCESGIETTALWESMRGVIRELGLADIAGERTATLIATAKNPYEPDCRNRETWIPSDIPVLDASPIGFFAGCTIAFRHPQLGQAALRILARSDTPFCMLENQESCCGSFLFRTGAWKDYGGTITSMIEELERKGVKTLVVACAGCMKTITADWPRVYGKALPFKPVPFMVFLRDLIREEKIRFSSRTPVRVAYHDPCHGARHLVHHLGRDWVFEAPREVLSSIPGLNLVEFPENREFQVCCGAGGGVKVGDPGLARTIANEKIENAHRLNADILASTCPFCRRNLEDARVASGSSVEVIEVIELVDRMMDF